MEWIEKGEQTVWKLLGAPAGAPVSWVLGGIAILTLLLVYGRVSRLTEIPHSGGVVSLGAVALGLAILVGLRVMLDGWLLPLLEWSPPGGGRTALALAGSVLIMVPLMRLVLKAHPLSALMTWGTGLLAMVVVVLALRTGLQVAEAGSESAERTKARSAEMQDFLEGE